jgi:chromosome partitioning protein
MHVVALCSQKGGSGNTTLSGHLAVQAELAGAGPVALIDTDPQGSLAAWWNATQSEAPAFASTSLAQLPAHIERLRLEGCSLVVIDTPPAINMAIR